jgi:hypothetical protein
MGGDGAFLIDGGFDRKAYELDVMVGDIKVLRNPERNDAALPEFSNTPHTAYYRKNDKGKITQIRFYRGRYAKMDVDWGHAHKGLPANIPHIHTWKVVKDTTGTRKSGVHLVRQQPRLINAREWKILEPLLRNAGFQGDYKK